MARVNRWKQFGDAFNAVYNAGTQLGAAIETGGIAMKDYEDEEGKKLTGLALDRAKMDDYAAIELKYGDPLKSLKMRTGVEQLGQNRIRTDNLQDDLTSIRGLRDAQAEFTGARTSALNLGTRIRQGSESEEIAANKAGFLMAEARDTGLATAMKDDAYTQSLIKGYEADAAESAANAVRFESKEYKDWLSANDLRNTALAKEQYVASEINRSILENPEYQTNFIANELVKMQRTLKTNEIANMIAQDPATAEIAKNNLETTLNNSITAVENSEVLKRLAENPAVQEFKYQSGLSTAETAALDAENTLLAARKSLQMNKFIEEWGKTSDPKDPTSMLTLIEGIKAIDPERGMALERNYGEHELWEITNNSLLMKAEANQAMAQNGAEGVRTVLDKYNGDKLGVRLDKNKDGSFVLVETRNVGPGKTEIVRTIAQGKDEQSFMKDITAVLDPASLMEYSMNLVDMKYKEGLTMYNKAQAKAALAKKPLTMEQWAASVIQDKNASLFDKQLALAVSLKDNVEAYERLSGIMNVEEGLSNSNISNDSVKPKLSNNVNIDGPETAEEQAAATSLLEILASPNATATDRENALAGNNRKLLAKYHPTALVMEDNKTDAAKEFVEALDKGDITLDKAGLEELINNLTTTATAPKKSGQGSKNDATNKATAKRLADFMSNNNNAASVLQVVIAEMQTKIRDIGGLSKAAKRNIGGVKNKNAEVARQIEELQALIAELSQGR